MFVLAFAIALIVAVMFNTVIHLSVITLQPLHNVCKLIEGTHQILHIEKYNSGLLEYFYEQSRVLLRFTEVPNIMYIVPMPCSK